MDLALLIEKEKCGQASAAYKTRQDARVIRKKVAL